MIWENIKSNIRTSIEKSLGLYQLKQHKLWFCKECLRFLGPMNQVEMQEYRIQTKAM